MRHRHTQLARHDGASHGRSYIPHHQAKVAALLQQDLLVARHDGAGLLGLRARAHFKVDVGLGNAQLLKKATRHCLVVMLAGVDQAVAQRATERLRRL